MRWPERVEIVSRTRWRTMARPTSIGSARIHSLRLGFFRVRRLGAPFEVPIYDTYTQRFVAVVLAHDRVSEVACSSSRAKRCADNVRGVSPSVKVKTGNVGVFHSCEILDHPE